MELDLYQIDAFTSHVFGGNPACVVKLDHWLEDTVLRKIAQENAVAETAFFINKDDKIKLRWFTPEIEMDLCGHATLATAHVILSVLSDGRNEITFDTASGDLIVSYNDGLYTLDFPSRKPTPAKLPKAISDSLNILPLEVHQSRDFLLLYGSEQEVLDIKINRHSFDQINLDPGGVIVTAIGEESDFVSRFFTPQASILEDPVTGSAHCSLIPFWAERLDKDNMMAYQLSQRRGQLFCEAKGERVLISGHAQTYSTGKIWV